MIWPWRDHEGCVVYLLREHGEVVGRLCKGCHVIELHLRVDPGEVREGTLDVDPIPVGSA